MNIINEYETRTKWIDTKLIKSGWTKIIDFSTDLDLSSLHRTAVRELPTDDGFADYVLYINGKPYAVVEAKKLGLNPRMSFNKPNDTQGRLEMAWETITATRSLCILNKW